MHVVCIVMSSSSRFLPTVFLSLLLVVICDAPAVAQPQHDLSRRTVIVPAIEPPSDIAIERAHAEATARLQDLCRALAPRAIGVVLARDLDLDGLEAALAERHASRSELVGTVLDPFERALRRTVPESLQPAVNDLRAAVGRLGKLMRLAADDAGVATSALATLTLHLAEPGLRATEAGEQELRDAFARAATLVPEEVLGPLRRQLAQPNDVGFVSRDFIAWLARQHVEQPVEFARSVEGARIAGSGRVALDLSATVPESVSENRLLVHATGSGTIAATADRRRVHVRATALPGVRCTQAVHILPQSIAGDTPEVAATFRTQLERVRIDGALGRCRLVQRVAGRAIGEALAANDPRVAATLEDAVRERVREEGLQLAYRVNGLLRSTVWEQLRAVDYEPAVDLHNDSAGIWSATTWAHADELGALTPRPTLPSGPPLDVVRFVHESVVTGALGGLAGATIDEATVRGLWETQFKLSSPEWDALPGGRVPAAIRLADEDPLTLRFVPDGVVLDVRATGCDLDGRRADDGPRGFRIRYRVRGGPTGLGLVRDAIEFADDVPADARPVWEKVLPLFCARDIQPLPRFPNRLARQLVQLAHLHTADGWLVVGLERAPAVHPATGGIAHGSVVSEVRR